MYDARLLTSISLGIAAQYPHAMEHNVLVVGMPNVGKSTLLNALRNMGIKGRKLSAFQLVEFAYTQVMFVLSYSQSPPNFRVAGTNSDALDAVKDLSESSRICFRLTRRYAALLRPRNRRRRERSQTRSYRYVN